MDHGLSSSAAVVLAKLVYGWLVLESGSGHQGSTAPEECRSDFMIFPPPSTHGGHLVMIALCKDVLVVEFEEEEQGLSAVNVCYF